MTIYMLVFSNAVAGKEDEYNEWYSNVHLKEVAAVEGIKNARRFTLTEAQINPEQPHKYLAMYEIEEGTGAQQTITNMMAGAGDMNMSDALDSDGAYVTVMSSITDFVT